jgi:tRNA pseudouridine32 synthase/23S rRNA pseudouridine746 synthase
VTLNAPPLHHYRPPAHSGLDILYRDDALLLVNKPAGLLSVPGRGADKQDCMARRVQEEFPDARIVHRLDMETSGLLLMALGATPQRLLGLQFERRVVRKRYIAMVHGRLPATIGTIDLPLCADWPNRPRQKVGYQEGRPSLTHYRLLACDPARDTSRVELIPVTGRSHQLRVHLLSLGHPILGDSLYGSPGSADRLLLHAWSLRFAHPVKGHILHFDCPPGF